MKKLALLSFFLYLTLHSFSQSSHIQIIAESGITIFLDGKYQGVTKSSLSGLIISDLDPGTYTIKAVKENFQPQEGKVTLRSGEVKEYRVRPFTPNISIEESGDTGSQTLSLKTGSFKVQSLPISIKISVPSLNVEREKKQDEWLAKKVPEGSYRVTFEWDGKRLTEEIEIAENELTHVFVDMINQKVEYRKRPGKFGKLIVTSDPSSTIYIGGKRLGYTPLEAVDLKADNYKLTFNIALNNQEYLDYKFTYAKSIAISNKKTTTAHYDLFKDRKFGELEVVSSQGTVDFILLHRELDHVYSNQRTNFSKQALVGSYYLRLPGDYMKNDFTVTEGKTTHIKLTKPTPTLSYKGITAVSDYQSFNSYFSSKYRTLDEYKMVSQVYWDPDNNHWLIFEPWDLTVWGAFWNVIAKAGFVGFIWGIVDENSALAWGGVAVNLVARWGIAPLHTRSKKVKDPESIAKNKEAEAFYKQSYKIKQTKWEKELDEINSGIREKNKEIEKKNQNIEEVEISYK